MGAADEKVSIHGCWASRHTITTKDAAMSFILRALDQVVSGVSFFVGLWLGWLILDYFDHLPFLQITLGMP